MQKNGFSLIGVIVAMFIVMTGIVGVLVLMNQTLKSVTASKNKLIAAGLAQEGVELLRDNRATASDWNDWGWYSDAIATGTVLQFTCEYDGDWFAYSTDEPLKLDSATGLYQYGTGDNSSFYRLLTVTKVSGKEVKGVVEVKWQDRGLWRYLTVEDHLWNWK